MGVRECVHLVGQNEKEPKLIFVLFVFSVQ